MSEIKELTEKINAWVEERNWEENQKPKDLAISLSLEAAEVLEHFQWRSDEESEKHTRNNKQEVADELADVAIYLLKMADKLEIDLYEAVKQKLIKASKKYPAEEVKGKPIYNNIEIKKEAREKKK